MNDVAWLAVAGLAVAGIVIAALLLIERRERSAPVLAPSAPVTGAGRTRKRGPATNPGQPLPRPTTSATPATARLGEPQEISAEAAATLHREVESFLRSVDPAGPGGPGGPGGDGSP